MRATDLPHATKCRSCSEPIMFVTGPKGTPLPVEVQPSTSGNVVLAYDGKHWNAGVLTPGQAAGARADGQRTYLSHFASCPTAEAHRKRAQRAAIKARSKR